MTNLNDAAFQEQAIAQWRDWRRFLSLHLQLIDLRSAPRLDGEVFEVEDSADDRERAIKQQLAVIPGDVRSLFERMVEERRQQVQATMDAKRRASGDSRSRPLDADEVERATLTALLDEADGVSSDGIGQVPMADGWYDVDAEKLRDVPDETRYRLASAKRLPAARLAAIVGVIVLGVAAMWLTRPGQSGTASAAGPAVVAVNDQPVEQWMPRSVTLTGEQSITLPVVKRAEDADPQATQWDAGAWPLTICIPGEAITDLTSVQVASVGDAPARAYAIRNIAPEASDLIVGSCDDSSKRSYGAFQSIELPAIYATGEVGQFNDGRSVTVQSIAVVGPGQDTKLPQGKAQVVVTVTTPSLDWSQVNATLRWPDGQDVLPSESTVRADGMSFRYLVPLFETPLEVVQWRVTDPASGETLFWQSPLEPPPTRLQVISQSLSDVQAQAERTAGGTLHITVVVKNTGDQALALTESDITVTQDGRRLPIPPLESLRAPLAVGEQRTIDLVMNIFPRQTVTLSLGAFAFQITP